MNVRNVLRMLLGGVGGGGDQTFEYFTRARDRGSGDRWRGDSGIEISCY